MRFPSRLFPAAVAIAASTAVIPSPAFAAPIETTVGLAEGQHQLLRGGQPYFIKGVGGDASLELLASAGGNSFRTWGDEKLAKELPLAEKLGLTVTAGIWLGQVRQGFRWNDTASLKRQMDHVRSTVEKYKDAPALLVWALGNEMEDGAGRNIDVWKGINDLAKMVKEIDPHHPTMTVIAEIGGEKVQNIHRYCPDIDMIGINSYGGAASLGERYKKAGGTKPYVVTEFGPAGIWEIGKNAIGAYAELSSTEKADIYRRAYHGAVASQPGVCLGSYAFLWGNKQEATATWFSMFLSDRTRLGAVDAMQELWSGKAPANRCPTIASLKLDSPAMVDSGATVRALLDTADPENDPLTVTWTLQRDPEQYGNGGDHEGLPPTFPEAIARGDLHGAEVHLPKDSGLYRLFATVRDNHGGGAVANITIRVKGDGSLVPARKATLPLVIYDEAGNPPTYISSGWMGDTKSIKLEPDCTEQPHTGKTCMRCDFTAPRGWGGVIWQNPEQNWGDRSGGYDLTGAKRLTFWARGAKGGEVVSFKFGIVPKDKRYCDTAKGELANVTLTPEWKQYSIDAAGQDLSRIVSGFSWNLSGQGQPVTFYLDDIRWE